MLERLAANLTREMGDFTAAAIADELRSWHSVEMLRVMYAGGRIIPTPQKMEVLLRERLK
jgi:hypothetical protein